MRLFPKRPVASCSDIQSESSSCSQHEEGGVGIPAEPKCRQKSLAAGWAMGRSDLFPGRRLLEAAGVYCSAVPLLVSLEVLS